MLNNQTEEVDSNNNLKGYLIISMWSASFLFDVIIFYVIVASFRELVRVEFAILFIMRTYTVIFKAMSIIAYVTVLFDQFILGPKTQIIVQSILNPLAFVTSITFIYYSLYHITLLSRTSFVRILSDRINQPRTFIILSLGIAAVAILFNTIVSSVLQNTMYTSTNTSISIFEFQVKTFPLTLSQIMIPAVIPSAVYLLGMCATLRQLLGQSSRVISSESKRCRRNMILFVKFSMLALTNMLYILPKSIYVWISLTCYGCSKSIFFQILTYLGDVFFITGPIILIFVHSILLKTFINIFSKARRSLKLNLYIKN